MILLPFGAVDLNRGYWKKRAGTMANLSNSVRVGVLGASGYTGADLVRLLVSHPQADIALMTAERHADKPMADVFPHLGGYDLPTLRKVDEADWSQCDVVICGLPHGTSQEIIASLPERVKVVDMSADFRLRDMETYATWYGHEHRAPQLQEEATYALTEHYRDQIRDTRLAACPGCYPTAALLLMTPLVEAGLVDADDIVIDAKSGSSGSGRGLKENMLFCEVAEGVHPLRRCPPPARTRNRAGAIGSGRSAVAD